MIRVSRFVTFEVWGSLCDSDNEPPVRRVKKFLLPKEIPDEEVGRIVGDLAIGLSKLGYQYAIYRGGVPPKIALLAHKLKPSASQSLRTPLASILLQPL